MTNRRDLPIDAAVLPLNSAKWTGLQHAYGAASDTQSLLLQLANFPPENTYKDEPWFSLWSSLCHQDMVYQASFAATPHIIHALAKDPQQASIGYFLLPANIEVCRVMSGTAVPIDLEPAYRTALGRLPTLVAAATKSDWSHSFCAAALAATAVATGNYALARLLLEISPDEIEDVVEWMESG